jgi:hypothetical protein
MRDRVLLKGEIMVRFGVAIATLACMAVPALAQESTEQLKKELQELRAEVEGLKAVNQSKEIPAATKQVDGDAMAADESPVMTLFKQTKLSGFVDTSYEFSFNTLNSSKGGGAALLNAHNGFRAFDNRDNSFYVNEAHVTLQRLASKDMIVGYRIDLAAGHDPSIYDGSTVSLQQAWVQILAPLGDGLDIRAGKMEKLAGYEVLANMNNMNYTRGLLWFFAEPKTSTGVRASYGMGGADNDMFTATLGFSNGFNFVPATGGDTFADTDHGKAAEMQVAVKPIKDAEVAATFIVDNDTSNVSVSTRDGHYLFDLMASYTIDKLTVAFVYDKTAAQEVIGIAPRRAQTSGFALYGKYLVNDWFAQAIRFEYLSFQRDAVAPRDPRVFEFTITEEFKIAKQMILRIEFRHDDENVKSAAPTPGIIRNGVAARGDNTLGVELIMPF